MTVIALHGGAGIQQALAQAAQAGHGRCFDELRAALTEAEITRQPPWGPLARLGERWDVRDLQGLAASVHLAGSEGARITASLTAKADSLRTTLLADSEARASSATERMSLPVVLLFAAFLLFVGYPACANALSGL
ncbi:type II secretion system F family protein [Streptacidiphilus monticola]